MAKRSREEMERLLDQFEQQKERQLREILEQIEEQRRQFEGREMNFTAPDEEQLRRKLFRSNSPMIVFQGWSGSTSPGGAISYTVGINNPDPFTHIWLFVHLFIGPANVASDVGTALPAVDERFPRLTMPEFSGLTLSPSDTQSLSFSIDVPGSVEPSNYLGNSFLFHFNWHDVGENFDRSVFVFEVT